MFHYLFRVRKYKIASFPTHYQIYVKLLRFGKYEPIKEAKVKFDPFDIDEQAEALIKIEIMKEQLVLKQKPVFIKD
ncbi:unnamed protein product [Scytosiphon promiscuus]